MKNARKHCTIEICVEKIKRIKITVCSGVHAYSEVDDNFWIIHVPLWGNTPAIQHIFVVLKSGCQVLFTGVHDYFCICLRITFEIDRWWIIQPPAGNRWHTPKGLLGNNLMKSCVLRCVHSGGNQQRMVGQPDTPSSRGYLQSLGRKELELWQTLPEMS